MSLTPNRRQPLQTTAASKSAQTQGPKPSTSKGNSKPAGSKQTARDAALLQSSSDRSQTSARSAGRKAAKLATERIQLAAGTPTETFIVAAQHLIKVSHSSGMQLGAMTLFAHHHSGFRSMANPKAEDRAEAEATSKSSSMPCSRCAACWDCLLGLPVVAAQVNFVRTARATAFRGYIITWSRIICHYKFALRDCGPRDRQRNLRHLTAGFVKLVVPACSQRSL